MGKDNLHVSEDRIKSLVHGIDNLFIDNLFRMKKFAYISALCCVGVMYSGECTSGQAYFSSRPGVDIHSE